MDLETYTTGSICLMVVTGIIWLTQGKSATMKLLRWAVFLTYLFWVFGIPIFFGWLLEGRLASFAGVSLVTFFAWGVIWGTGDIFARPKLRRFANVTLIPVWGLTTIVTIVTTLQLLA
jgi:hypothetical protein